MRRLVRDYIAAALNRQQPELEAYIAEHLIYGEAFPLVLNGPVVGIRWIGHVSIVPKLHGDYPPVDVTVGLRAAFNATASGRDPIRGVRTAAVSDTLLGRHVFEVDVEVEVLGMPAARGYSIMPRAARLTAWWGAT